MLLESKITGLPPLNINGQIKKKKNQKNSPTANTTPKRYNRLNWLNLGSNKIWNDIIMLNKSFCKKEIVSSAYF